MSSNATTERPTNRELAARAPALGLSYFLRFLFLMARIRLVLAVQQLRRRSRPKPEDVVRELLPDAANAERVVPAVLALDRYEREKARDIHALTVSFGGRMSEVVLKYSKPLAPSLQAFLYAANLGHCREVLFHRHLAHLLPVRTARLLGAWESRWTGEYRLLQEHVHGSSRPDHAGISENEARVALEAIAPLHCVALAELPRLDWIVGNTNDRPFRWLIIFFPRRFDGLFIKVFGALCNYLNGLETGLVHVDYRPGNLLFHFRNGDNAPEAVTMLDWFGVTISAPIFDVVYFMTLGLQPDQRRDHYGSLRDAYLQARSRSGSPYDRVAFDDDYQVVSLLFAMACHGYAEIELFANWNVDARQWDDWRRKVLSSIEDLDFERIAHRTGCPADELKQAAAGLSL